MYTFSFLVGNIISKSVKCIHSATKDSRRGLCLYTRYQGPRVLLSLCQLTFTAMPKEPCLLVGSGDLVGKPGNYTYSYLPQLRYLYPYLLRPMILPVADIQSAKPSNQPEPSLNARISASPEGKAKGSGFSILG